MTRGLAAVIVLLSCGVSRGGLLTNFAASYAPYTQCTMGAADFDSDEDIDGIDFLMWQRGLSKTGMFITPYGDADRNGNVNLLDMNLWGSQYATNVGISDSVCFKLYLDPQGVVAGSVTVVIDVPNPAGQSRLSLGGETGLVDVNPQYTAQVLTSNIIPLPNRQRLEAQVQFAAVDPTNPPAGPITIFGFQAHDNLPQLGFAGAQVGFDFRPGNSITVFDTDNGQTTTFGDAQLTDVGLQPRMPVILEVNTVNGLVSLRGAPSSPVEINFYEIKSVAGALNVNGWASLDKSEGLPPGVGWEEISGSSALSLSERNPTGTLFLGPGQTRFLGQAYNRFSNLRDLTFMYKTPQGALIPGQIVYSNIDTSKPVPEPGGLGLVLVGCAGAAARRRRAR